MLILTNHRTSEQSLNFNQWENCQKYAHRLFKNACTWPELDVLIFFGLSTNWLVQLPNGLKHVTDDWQDLFRTFILHTDYRQYCHVGNTAQHCRLGLFQDPDFAGDLGDSKSTFGGIFCLFGRRTFVPVNWMRKKQTSVSHGSTESEIVSVDAGLRMDGLLALDLWDIVIQVLRSPQTNKKRSVTASGNRSKIAASSNGSTNRK